ncbi:MAG: ArnT family glycosyltransferase [Acidimicrobiales bacterium]
MPEAKLTDSWNRWTWLIGGTAFVVRFLVVLAQPILITYDAADYNRLGISLATGHGWGTSHFAHGGGPTALRPPLYPMVLGVFYKVFGVHVTGARLLAALLGAVTVVLLIAATWLLWGRRVALVAGAVAALFPPMVMASTSLMSEAVALPLEMAALLFALHHRQTRNLWWALSSGAALGLMTLTRPSLAVLVLPLILLLGGVLTAGRDRQRDGGAAGWIRRLTPAVALVLAGTLVVLPWLIRDRLTLHTWVPITTQDGFVVSGTYNTTSGNDPDHPAAWRPATYDPTISAIIATHPHADEVQTDALLQSAATRYLRQHPAYLAKVVYYNTRRLFDLTSPSEIRAATTQEYGLPGKWGDAEMASGILILVLALAGLALRQGRRVPVAYLVAPVLLWLSTVVLQAIPRFRAVIDPFLIQLAAVALLAAWARVNRMASGGNVVRMAPGDINT